MPLNRQTRNRGSLPARESATVPVMIDSFETLDPLGFFTFDNSSYDQEIHLDDSWGLEYLVCG
jgi:hypothetical protein